MMFNLTSLFGLTLASLGVAIVGPLSHHYYTALVAVAITVILDLDSRVNDRCQKKSAMPLQIRDIDEELPYAASALLDSGAAWA